MVELAGEVADGKAVGGGGQLVVEKVDRGLAENGGAAAFKERRRNALHVIAVQDAEILQVLDAQKCAKLLFQGGGLHGKGGLFLGIDAIDHCVLPRMMRNI